MIRQYTILGRVPSKKNSRINTKSGSSFPSKKYTEWESDAWSQLVEQGGDSIESYPVSLTVNLFMPDLLKADIDNKLGSVCDLIKDKYARVNRKMTLIEKRIIADDNWVNVPEIHATAQLDRGNPRVEIIIASL